MPTLARPHQTEWVVEAWRALAAWLVVLAHFGPPAGLSGPLTAFAFTGVNLFFVLSGFVFGPYWLQAGPYCWQAFALRRVFRIYPAYLLALTIMVLIAWMQSRPLFHLPEHLLFLHVQSREMAFYYNPAFWSLPAEVAFYMTLPWLVSWSAARPTRLWGMALFALVMRICLVLTANATEQNVAYVALHHLPGIAIEFAAGIMARDLSERWATLRKMRWASCWTIVATAAAAWYVLALVFLIARAQAWGFAFENVITLMTVPCFAFALAATGAVGKTGLSHLSTPWWVRLALWLGGLSYGVYLTHVAWLQGALLWQERWGPSMAFGGALLGTALSAWVVHRWCEAPARHFGRRWAQRLEARWHSRRKI